MGDGIRLDTAEDVKRWVFCGREESFFEKEIVKSVKGMLKRAEKKERGAFEREYLNPTETAGANVHWRLTATAIGMAPPRCLQLCLGDCPNLTPAPPPPARRVQQRAL